MPLCRQGNAEFPRCAPSVRRRLPWHLRLEHKTQSPVEELGRVARVALAFKPLETMGEVRVLARADDRFEGVDGADEVLPLLPCRHPSTGGRAGGRHRCSRPPSAACRGSHSRRNNQWFVLFRQETRQGLRIILHMQCSPPWGPCPFANNAWRSSLARPDNPKRLDGWRGSCRSVRIREMDSATPDRVQKKVTGR